MAALATADDLAARMGRAFDVTEEAQANALLDSASALIRAFCRRDFALHTDEVVELQGTHDRALRLPGLPVTDVSAVLLDGAVVDDWSLVGGTLWRPHGWQVRYDGVPSLVSVTYTHGYSVIPEDVEAVALNMAQRGFTNADGALQGLTVGDIREEYAASVVDARNIAYMTREDKDALRRYRRTVASIQLRRV